MPGQDPTPPRYFPPPEHRIVQRDEAFGPDVDRGPTFIYAAGDTALLHAPMRVSVVGARQASAEGLRRAGKLASLLAARGVVVVSGLAEGVDAAAHRAAITAGGRTIAVIGTPLDRCYPSMHALLQEEIYRKHLLITQFASGSQISGTNFPARNRTMAMVSHASVVVEASDSSGSLSQAAEIQRLGRPLFILRNVAENRTLNWPRRFLNSGAQILDDVEALLAVLRHGSAARNPGVEQLPLRDVAGVGVRGASQAV